MDLGTYGAGRLHGLSDFADNLSRHIFPNYLCASKVQDDSSKRKKSEGSRIETRNLTSIEH